MCYHGSVQHLTDGKNSKIMWPWSRSSILTYFGLFYFNPEKRLKRLWNSSVFQEEVRVQWWRVSPGGASALVPALSDLNLSAPRLKSPHASWMYNNTFQQPPVAAELVRCNKCHVNIKCRTKKGNLQAAQDLGGSGIWEKQRLLLLSLTKRILDVEVNSKTLTSVLSWGQQQ